MTTLSLYERIGGNSKIEILLRNFYATVREHPDLGPIFNRHVKDWPSHLKTIGEFWALQTGGPSAYRGGMGAKHLPLRLQPQHFTQWLAQWEQSCRLHFAEPEANEMIALAHQLGARLQGIVSGNSGGLPIGRHPFSPPPRKG